MKYPITVIENGYMTEIDCLRLSKVDRFLMETEYVRSSITSSCLHYFKPQDIMYLLKQSISYTDNYLFDIEESSLFVFCKFPEEVEDLQLFIDQLHEASGVQKILIDNQNYIDLKLISKAQLKQQMESPEFPQNVFDDIPISGLELLDYCQAAYQQGYYKEALFGYLKAQVLYPNMEEVVFNSAMICYELKLFKLAIKFFENINKEDKYIKYIKACEKVAN